MNAKILKAAWFTPGIKGRWGLPLLFQGKPGTAKTATIEPTAAMCGLHCETVIASLREPADFLGMPVIDTKNNQVHYAAPAWARKLVEKRHGVVFYDEFNTAAPAVRAALLRTTQEGFVGDTWLPNTIRFVAAQNSVDDAEGGYDLSAPTANRWGHIDWPAPSAAEWTDWILGQSSGGSADELVAAAEEARVEAAWPAPFARAKGLVAGFIKRRPELLHKQPKGSDPQLSRAWCSPRTWEMALRAMAGAEVHGLSQADRDTLVAAFIGEAAAVEFAVWQNQVDLPDPAELLDGRVRWTHDAARLDRTVAVFDSCAALVCPVSAENRNARVTKLWVMLSEVLDTHPDLAVSAARSLVGAQLNKVGDASAVIRKLAPILAAANFQAR